MLQAAQQFAFDPASAVIIGDKSTDIELGRRLNAVTMLVSADGEAKDGEWVQPDYVVSDLVEAARIICTL